MSNILKINEARLIRHRAKRIRMTPKVSQAQLELMFDEMHRMLGRMEGTQVYMDTFNQGQRNIAADKRNSPSLKLVMSEKIRADRAKRIAMAFIARKRKE
jgi:hypothetical protein